MKIKLNKFLQLSVFAVLATVFPLAAHASFNYPLMEGIPGFANPGDTINFYTYVADVYKFGIWAIGIAALLMIVIGGYMYIMSAGNNSMMEKAKGVITDAIIGIIMVMTAYVLLYEINPNLVQIKPFSGPAVSGVSGTSGTSGGNTVANSPCKSVTTGPCSVAKLTPYFGSNADKASAICMAESQGIETKASTVDICQTNGQPNGQVVSWGLFQINLSANPIAGIACPAPKGAFNKQFTGSNKDCTAQQLYSSCVNAAKNADNNIKEAASLSNNGTSWGKWGSDSKCGF